MPFSLYSVILAYSNCCIVVSKCILGATSEDYLLG